MKITTLLTAATLLFAMGTTTYADDTTAPNPPARSAPHFKRAVRFGICVGEQLSKSGETLAKPVKGETAAQKQARKDANKALVKAAAQAGNCGKRKPKPTA